MPAQSHLLSTALGWDMKGGMDAPALPGIDKYCLPKINGFSEQYISSFLSCG